MSASYLAARSVRTEGGCVLWLLRPMAEGYGRAKIAGRRPLAHRLAYEVYVGPIEDGHDVHHECANRLCINPAHLVQMPHRAHSGLPNSRRKTHCIHGHSFDQENTYWYRGKRQCRACGRGWKAIAYAAARQKEGSVTCEK